jgi:hypothetical protein
MPQPASTGSAEALAWYLKWLPSTNRWVSPARRGRAGGCLHTSNCVLIPAQIRDTVDFDTTAALAAGLDQHRLHVAGQQPAHEPGDHQRLQRSSCAPSRATFSIARDR